MYIEFQLPKSKIAADFAFNLLTRYLKIWAEQYNIVYNQKIYKYTLRLTFDDNKFYDFFALTWNPDSRFKEYLLDYRFVEPMRRV
jgi:hypothetical protein